LIDEAHVLRNPLALWTFGAMLVSQNSARSIMATGTPYNNKQQDLASLHAIFEPSSVWAKVEKWEGCVMSECESEASSERVIEELKAWREPYFLREYLNTIIY